MVTSKEQEADITAYFSAVNKAQEIQATNDAQALKLQSTNNLIDFTKSLNMRLANEYSKEVKRVSGIEAIDAQDEIGKAISDASMSQGITGGASKGRIVQTTALKASEALGKKQQATESIVSKLTSQVAKDNQVLELQKQQAYNAMIANSISGPMAALQIQSASIEGYKQGLDIGVKKEKLGLYNI